MSKEVFSAFLGPETKFSGNLQFKGTVRINGHYTGDIVSEGKLILGKDAFVKGNINVKELGVAGVLEGEIKVSKQTILYKTAKVYGVLETSLLTMEEGAIFQGNLKMQKEDSSNHHTGLESSLSSNLQELESIPKQ